MKHLIVSFKQLERKIVIKMLKKKENLNLNPNQNNTYQIRSYEYSLYISR